MDKNDIIELKIDDMGADGAGIGRADGLTFFVKDAVIGDFVRAKVIKLKKTYGYARLMEITEASPWRVDPPCVQHRRCGGCQIQALSYEKQLEFKQNKVTEDLHRIGGFEYIPMEPIEGMENPWNYRNKAQYPVGRDKDGHIVAGFFARRTHHIIPVKDCPIGAKVNKEILDTIISVMEEYDIEPYDEESGSGLIRHILIRCGFNTGEIMVCFVINGDHLKGQQVFVDRLAGIRGMTSICVSRNKKRTNVILGDTSEAIWGSPYITDSIGGIKYQISALSFYQVNPLQTEKLYAKALEYALSDTKGKTVWDLYCGIGTISLFLAHNAKMVYGVEIVPEAVEDAKRNAVINGIDNAEFFCGKAEEILPEFYKKHSCGADREHMEDTLGTEVMACPDVIVVDPPRKGCDKLLLDTILKMGPDRVVYISCDPATMARDLKILREGGYELKKVKPYDQFCHSVHVETVCLLSNRKYKPDAYVDLSLDMEDYRRIKAESKE